MPCPGIGIAPFPDADGAFTPGTGISPGLPAADAGFIPGIGICPPAGLPAAFIPGTGIPADPVADGRAGVPGVGGTGMPAAWPGCFARALPLDRLSLCGMAPPGETAEIPPLAEMNLWPD